jgi:hypothetical protein
LRNPRRRPSPRPTTREPTATAIAMPHSKPSRPTLPRTGRALPLLLLALAAAACGKPQALGDVNAVVVAVPTEAWSEIEPAVESALETRSFTVRDERILRVTQVAPTTARWGELRRFRQLLLIGEPGDPWIAEALDRARGPVPAPPAVVRARNVWARGQQVTIALHAPGTSVETVTPLLPEIGDTLLRDFNRYIAGRMFASGADSALADSLQQHAGFRLVVPKVYRHAEVEPGVYVFRNDFPKPSELIRAVVVASRPSGEVPLTKQAAIEWRSDLSSRLYDPPQMLEETIAPPAGAAPAGAAVQVQGVWTNPPEGWPAAGPFLTRLVECPAEGRTWLLDAWLYAPGKEKYEYMVQLVTIRDSFACAAAPRAG